MRLVDIMSTPLEIIGAEARADDAREKMARLGLRHLAVMGKDRAIAGVLSDRDLARGARGQTVGELMTRQVITAPPDATVRRAANLLRGHNIGCLPIVDRGRPVGIVTVSDLLELVGRGGFRPPLTGGQRPVLATRGPRAVRKRG
jgi:CBS domain-containing protein